MKLRKVVCIAFIFLNSSFCLNAQRTSNIWYFGKGVGLNFNNNPPTPLTGGALTSIESCSSVADKNGNLLFYTNGVSVNNRKKELMIGGVPIGGDMSSTNGAVIIPFHGNDSLYYIFTTGAASQDEQNLAYSIVNINRDGGYGEVIQKNNIIEDKIIEKLTVVSHCNKKDFWVIVRKWNTDEYHSYLVTSTGINSTPVVSHTGLVVSGAETNAIGVLKSSTNNKKLAAVHGFQNDLVELMDFDNITGVISNAITFKPNAIPHAPGFIGIYGAEFSPNGNLLYISANNSLTNPATLFQFDITSHNPTTILSTKQIIAEPTPWYGGALQMGPDQKIYMSMWKDSAISVVENPDVVGAGCNFVLNKISFGLPASAEVLQYGLPNFMQSNFDPNLRPYDFYRGGNCTDLTVPFFINRLTGIDSVKWDFGDTQLSTQLNPVHPYATPGFYTVKLKVYYFNPCSGLEIDESSTKIWITGNENILGNDLEACVFNNEKIIAQINLPSANYLWNTGATTTEITTSSPGKYWLTLDYLGCKISDTINLFIKPPPIVNIGPDTTVCNAKPIILSGGNYVNATYLWNTGEKTRDIIINRAGKYYVTVTTDCVASDTVNVIAGDCEIFIPTAFTPNGDTKNDKFGVANDFSAKEFHFVVYDRWGNLIFETKENTKKWDGTYKGKTMPTGSYLWTMKYTTLKGIPKYEQGTVMLIR